MSLPSFGQNAKDSLQYEVDLNVAGRRISGTFSQVVVGGGINADIFYKNWHLENNTSYRYNKTNTRLVEDNWYELITLKYYHNGYKKLYPGVFYFYETNIIYRVDKRYNYGLGLGSVLDHGTTKLSLLAALASENSHYNGFEFENSDIDDSKRNNGLFLFRLNNAYTFADKKITFSYQLFYLQSLKEGPDFDIRLNSRISFKVFKELSVFAAYNYRFENVHLEALSNYNDIGMFGINWALRS